MSKRVLIVEDDQALARILHDNLEYDGFTVEHAEHRPDVFAKLQRFCPDLVLLDLMLPDADGFEICRDLCLRKERPPVIILSARSQKDDKVRGLNLGADDYVTKPFAIEELLARINAVLRRRGAPTETLTLGDAVIDLRARRATRQGKDLALTAREFEMLAFLAERAGRVVSRDELLHLVWGYREAPLTRTVDIAIARLRRKIEPDPHHPRFIRTVHGDGYSLTPETT